RDWSSDVCSSDLGGAAAQGEAVMADPGTGRDDPLEAAGQGRGVDAERGLGRGEALRGAGRGGVEETAEGSGAHRLVGEEILGGQVANRHGEESRSEEHTS